MAAEQAVEAEQATAAAAAAAPAAAALAGADSAAAAAAAPAVGAVEVHGPVHQADLLHSLGIQARLEALAQVSVWMAALGCQGQLAALGCTLGPWPCDIY